MTLEEFLKGNDYPGAIVLLEGKRKVLETNQEKLYELGKLLAAQATHILFRSVEKRQIRLMKLFLWTISK